MTLRLDADYYFFSPSIKEEFGGLTNALFKRALLFWKHQKVATNILTFNYDPELDKIRKMLIDTNKLVPEIPVLNLYEFLENPPENNKKNINKQEILLSEEGLAKNKDKDKNAIRFFDNGRYVMYKRYQDDNQTLEFIDYFDEQRNRTKRVEYVNGDYIGRIVYMDLQHNKPTQELFYTSSGNCYLSKWYKIKKGKSSLDRIIWFEGDGSVKKVFKSEEKLQQYWLQSLIDKEKITFLVVDGRGFDNMTLSLEAENQKLFKIYVKHSTHLRPPYDPFAVIRVGNRPVFNNPSEPDAVVFLTEYQKKDAEARFGRRNNFFVLPHSYQRPASFPSFDHRDLTRAIAVARYHEEKQLDHIIEAFSQVVKDVPEAKLDIYGFGKEEENLQKLINELGLKENVKLKGVTENPDQEFETSAFSILTSKYEGFGLVVLESIAHGCPVISYDVKYGPRDMITSGENGELIEPDNKNQLADTMKDYFTNVDLEEKSRKAYESSSKFTPEQFMDRWGELFSQVQLQKEMRNSINDFHFQLEKSDWRKHSAGEYAVEGMLTLKGNYPKATLKDLDMKWKFQNRETKETFYLHADKIIESDKKWKLKKEFSLLHIYNGEKLPLGYWDVSLSLTWNNSFIEKRIGYSKSEQANTEKDKLKIDKGKVIQPYYTNPHGNLTFNVKKDSDTGLGKINHVPGRAKEVMKKWKE